VSRQRLCLTLAPVEAIEVTLDVEASLAVLRAERLAVLKRIADRLLTRDPGASANSFFALVGGRKADALEAFRAAKTVAEGLGPASPAAEAATSRSRPGPANDA
jgi:hypothetical protein